MKRKYIFVIDDKTNNYGVLSDFDFGEENNLDLHIARHKFGKSGIGKLLARVYFSGKVNYYLRLPFQYELAKISEYNFLEDTEYVLIVFNGSLGQYNYKVWNKLLKKHSNIHLVLVLWDSYDAPTFFGKMLRMDIEKVKWEYIFSFDKFDAKKHGFRYLDERYYSDRRDVIVEGQTEKKDVYFVSTIKPGRGEIIEKTYKYLVANNVKCDFEILIRTMEDRKKYAENAALAGVNFYDELKPYETILNELQDANCIMEILQTAQTAPSLRYFEAVMFNKKLLTNNPHIKELNFYDPRYMKYFERVEDIDVDWLKAREKVDYHYNGEFSPKRLLTEIEGLYGD